MKTTAAMTEASESKGADFVRGLLKAVAYLPWVSRVLVGLASSLKPILPLRWLLRLPLAGRFEVELATTDRVMFASRGGDSILRQLYWGGPEAFEKQVQRVMAVLARESFRIFDVGANTGVYTLLAARANPEARIWSFEPLPQAFEALRANITLNELTGVTAECLVVTDVCGPVDLHVPRAKRFIPTTASLHEDFRRQCEVLRVPGITLDAYREDRGVGAVDLLKIDVEAMEPAVLRGAESLLRRDRPWILCEVLPGWTEEQLTDVLAPLGYGFVWISEDGPVEVTEIRGHGGAGEANYLFVPEERGQRTREALWRQ